MMRELSLNHGMSIGCDPELFVVRTAGEIRKRLAAVGSEKILPPDIQKPLSNTLYISRDGVQVELHAMSSWCRQDLAGRISRCIYMLNNDVIRARVTLKDPSLEVSFQPMVTLQQRDLKALSTESRQLGCRESLNAYGREHISRDGEQYLIRTAAGHLHIGSALFTQKRVDPNEAVKVFDLMVGILCVLFDRDPSQKIRRETYGRAGEYRLPSHGLEYRVPSNFWLKDYRLQSFIFGIARTALKCVEGLLPHATTASKWALNTLRNKADFAEVERVINENDWDGALRIYKDCVVPVAQYLYFTCGIGKEGLTAIDYFIDQIHEKGLGHWFNISNKAILDRWLHLNTETGWERFILCDVEKARVRNGFCGIILDPAKTVTAVPIDLAKRRSKAIAEIETSLRVAA